MFSLYSLDILAGFIDFVKIVFFHRTRIHGMLQTYVSTVHDQLKQLSVFRAGLGRQH